MNKKKKNYNVVTTEYLRNIFKATDEARQSILKSFPYNKMTILFCQGLKVLLKNKFGNDIEFDRDEKFGCIHGTYKNNAFEIKVWYGIVLTLENEKDTSMIEVFKPIINEIMDCEPICTYDYCSRMENVYPTVEWNLHPNDRLYELINMPGNYCGCYIKNFVDLYTANTIELLQDDLLTKEGYNLIFGNVKSNINYLTHKIELIKNLRPDITNELISDWIDSNQNNKQFIKQ